MTRFYERINELPGFGRTLANMWHAFCNDKELQNAVEWGDRALYATMDARDGPDLVLRFANECPASLEGLRKATFEAGFGTLEIPKEVVDLLPFQAVASGICHTEARRK